jgi:hypothetical protein
MDDSRSVGVWDEGEMEEGKEAMEAPDRVSGYVRDGENVKLVNAHC